MDSIHAADHRLDARAVRDMPPDEFLAHGRAAMDWMAEYLRSVGDYPVLAEVRPGQVKASLAAEPPVDGQPFEQIMRDFQERILPGITHWNHPGFFGYFAITGSAPGIIGEMLNRRHERERNGVAELTLGHRAGRADGRLVAPIARSADRVRRRDQRHSLAIAPCTPSQPPVRWPFRRPGSMDSTEVHEEGSTPRSTPIHRSIKRSSLWALVAKAHATFRQTSCSR